METNDQKPQSGHSGGEHSNLTVPWKPGVVRPVGVLNRLRAPFFSCGGGMVRAENLVQLACPGLSLVFSDSLERP